MNYQQPSTAHEFARLTTSMAPDMKRFILLRTKECGWFTTDADNASFAETTYQMLFNLCDGHDDAPIFQVLFDSTARNDFAQQLSANFLSLDPTPQNPRLQSFVACIFNFYHDLYWMEYFRGDNPELSPQSMGNQDLSMVQIVQPAFAPQGDFPFFKLPGEIRNIIYKETLIVPDGGLVRSFTPPPLLSVSKRLRNEAMPLFYIHNHFEITVKRSAADELLARGRELPSVDMRVWRRFLDMWNVFNASGTNGLQYVEKVTLIYQLSMDNGCSFGSGEFDKRIGFRFSCGRFKEDLDDDFDADMTDGSDWEASESEQDVDEDHDDLDSEVDDLIDDIQAHDDEDTEHEVDEGQEQDHGSDTEEVPVEDIDPVGVFELNRGMVEWENCRETKEFLFHKICEYGTDRMWDVYPARRLVQMLWRCVRDCPRASENVDFLCEDLQYWMEAGPGYTRYESVGFYDPDDVDE
ncbi:hypothetical protein J7T55_014775 [Diaporthe amygdali]|uniref:uncharacterized protein n=1 Tax=Phomopsis amygdali TaxID=1214568 RepID=UPI0022FECE2B|nr:uncharacterized protein J7T55_014775 [Diaporthe amygdali]KAJ0109973.1 hypothetical protein J7T55_014775 [Diaporthe amygdali]